MAQLEAGRFGPGEAKLASPSRIEGGAFLAYQYLLTDVKEHIATLTLNRPEVRNSLNAGLMEELVDALGQARDDAEVRVVVLKGAGDKAFCAGADLGKIEDQAKEGIVAARAHLIKYAEIILALVDVGKPTIAQVQGYALAGGCGLVAACDLAVASENASFAVPEINVGIWGMIITAPMFRCVMTKPGLEMFYTGNRISAVEAHRIGLVNRVVPPERLEEETKKLAQTIAGKSPFALKMGREAFYTARDMEYTKAVKYLRELVPVLSCSEDAAEGIRAFLEKRAPQWKGR